ncbi:tetratricopeptide repeat protein [Aureibacter tunicatorum]|uniref:Tetratricopeptide (TPR) repeat protein n=1 Tax=Aureibacter tunicatorum TaxID=866807 RepID=A0AAE4BQ21_9BACT|nr:tetratricopeptide repeat protein [Aureibacter tunicatorum]MDR6237101.1 tetratricopeptide (TPR) repeat protein [Aureibacter tunicatorum]BDD06093.1 hypothetical protein AUTU_35760 [Aureibacter tunicatorum]
MNKSRIILLVVALGLSGALYTLPKYVVEDENGTENGVSQVEEHSADDGHDHSDHDGEMASHMSLMTEEKKEKLEKMTFSFNNSQSPEEKSIFADSLRTLYASVGRLDSAVKYAELAIPENPNAENLRVVADAYYEVFSVAMSAEQAKDYGSKAQTYYEKVMEEWPDSLGVKTRLAMTYLPTGQPMKAARMLKDVLKQEPEHEEALYNLGMMSIQSFQYDKGVERFQALLKIDPQNLQARYYLAVCYAELGKKESAKAEFNQVKNMSDDPVVHSTVDNYLKQL